MHVDSGPAFQSLLMLATQFDLFMEVNNFLYFIITSHKDAAPIMNMFWYDFEHALHFAVNGKPTGILHNHGHRLEAVYVSVEV